MTVSVEFDNETHEILALYLKVADGEVGQTIEIEEGACYVDEDKQGSILGIEMITPGEIGLLREKIARRYDASQIDKILSGAKQAFAFA